MSRRSHCVMPLSDVDRVVLQERARAYVEPFWAVVGAKIVSLAAAGMTTVDIAARLALDVDTVSKWRKRFAGRGWTRCATASGRAGRGRFQPRLWSRSRRWPVSRRGPAGAVVAVEFGRAGRAGG